MHHSPIRKHQKPQLACSSTSCGYWIAAHGHSQPARPPQAPARPLCTAASSLNCSPSLEIFDTYAVRMAIPQGLPWKSPPMRHKATTPSTPQAASQAAVSSEELCTLCLVNDRGKLGLTLGPQDSELWREKERCVLTLYMEVPSCAGDMLTTTPALCRAEIFSLAPPFPPAIIAPAWPILLPGGAVIPAMKDTTGLALGPWREREML